jgi:hypothetical protein
MKKAIIKKAIIKKAAKGRSKMADGESRAPQQNDDEGKDQEQKQPAPQLPPHPVQGLQAAPAPAPAYTPEHLDQDEQFLLLLAAIMFAKAGPGSVKDAYQHAKNLVQLLADDRPQPAAPAE